MALVFLSHSSADKPFVRKLAIDLMKSGYDVWLDEWDVLVGECILTGIEGGILKSDYAVIVLSPKAVASGWVDREWKAKYWTEVDEGKVSVLPLLLKDCEIPELLKTKRYADFRGDYRSGLTDLLRGLSPADGARFAFRERVLAAQRDLNDLTAQRIGPESKALHGKPLTFENHPERFAEVSQFAQESIALYSREVADDIDGIVEALPDFGLSNEDLTEHRKYTTNTIGWRKVSDALGDVARTLMKAN